MKGAIVLAAGSSRRFGSDKRKAKLGNGKMILESALEKALDNFEQVISVQRSRANYRVGTRLGNGHGPLTGEQLL